MRPDRTQAAGLILMLVILALGTALGVAIAELPADEGDLLSFSGSLIGAAIAVFGAMYLLEHQRHQSRRASRGVMKELLRQVLDGAQSVRAPEKIGDIEDYVPAVMQVTNADLLQEEIDALKWARTWFVPDTPGMVRAFAQIERLKVDRDAIRSDVRPQVMYGGLGDVERHLTDIETRAGLALSELDL